MKTRLVGWVLVAAAGFMAAAMAATPQERTLVRRSVARPSVVGLPVSYWILSGAQSGNGSQAKPFGSLGEALAASKAVGASRLDLNLGPGAFPGDVTVDKDMTIQGSAWSPTILAGTIRNLAGNTLILQHLSLQATNQAIVQQGGRLEMADVHIVSTRVGRQGLLFSANSGIAVVISGAARVNIVHSTMVGNQGTALFATGNGTTVWADDLAVRNNTVSLALKKAQASSGAYVHGNGAVEIGGQAHFYADTLKVMDNEMTGLRIDSGAQACIRHASFAGTKAYEGATGGHNVSVGAQAFVDMEDFVTEKGVFGLLFQNARGYLQTGEIRGNTVGLSIRNAPADFQVNCLLTPTVRTAGNSTALDDDTVSVPSSPGQGATPPPCPRIAWQDYQ